MAGSWAYLPASLHKRDFVYGLYSGALYLWMEPWWAKGGVRFVAPRRLPMALFLSGLGRIACVARHAPITR